MKKFFDDIKKDMKFKSAGPGKKLTEDTRSIAIFSQHYNASHIVSRVMPGNLNIY